MLPDQSLGDNFNFSLPSIARACMEHSGSGVVLMCRPSH